MTEHISDSDQGFKYDPKIMLESAQNKLAYLADGDFLQRSFRYYHKQKYGASSESPRVECVEIDRRDEKFQAIHIDSFNGAELLSFLSAVEFMLEERRLSIEIDSYITPELDSLISEMGQQAVGKIDSRKNIELFQRVLFSGATIANGIRSGGNKFSDIMPILEGREPLAAMVRKVPQSQYILTGYIEELQRKEFLEQPVGRVARWITTATTALLVSSALFDKFGELSAAIVTHFGLGAMDTFFLERLIKGETLAKFVNNRLRPFAR